MSYWKSCGLAACVAVCLLGETAGSAQAVTCGFSNMCATEWSDGSIINLGALPGSTSSVAGGINDSGQAVGSSFVGALTYATEWSGGKITNLGSLPGFTSSAADGINAAGQVVGSSSDDFSHYATEWSGGSAINLGGLPGSTESQAFSINDDGQIVGVSYIDGVEYATEWSGGAIINLGPGTAQSVNDARQIVGGNSDSPLEWSGGSVINLGVPPGLFSAAPPASTTPGRSSETATPVLAAAFPPLSGVAAASSTWEACQAPT